jgi:arsenate reductase
MIRIYGIPNCDTMKKARAWLDANDLAYEFHDFKKQGLEIERLLDWVREAGWEVLLNRRGMMWRKLDQETKDNIDERIAIQIMLDIPSIIKRPVLEVDGNLLVGFSEQRYTELLL